MSLDRPTEGALCDAKDCIQAAEFRVGFRVWATRGGLKVGAPAEAFTGLVVCSGHRDNVAPFNDVSWEKIRAGFLAAGKLAPDRETCEMVYLPITEGPWL